MPKTILAIDDDKNFLATLRDILEHEGYTVETLANPILAERHIESHKPDLLIIDVFMPERTGFNLVEDFNENKLYQDIPKIFLTCLDDDIERMTARASGVVHYMTKPLKPEELLKEVKQLIGNGK